MKKSGAMEKEGRRSERSNIERDRDKQRAREGKGINRGEQKERELERRKRAEGIQERLAVPEKAMAEKVSGWQRGQ
jgi:hypothetical protein